MLLNSKLSPTTNKLFQIVNCRNGTRIKSEWSHSSPKQLHPEQISKSDFTCRTTSDLTIRRRCKLVVLLAVLEFTLKKMLQTPKEPLFNNLTRFKLRQILSKSLLFKVVILRISKRTKLHLETTSVTSKQRRPFRPKILAVVANMSLTKQVVSKVQQRCEPRPRPR